MCRGPPPTKHAYRQKLRGELCRDRQTLFNKPLNLLPGPLARLLPCIARIITAGVHMLISGSSILASLATSTLNKINQTTAATTTKAADATSGDGLTAAPGKSAKDEFLDYAKLTPAQKMRAAILANMGLKEEDLKTMSTEERKKVEDKIKDLIKAQIDNGKDAPKGKLVDVTA
jgi:hypothetical protein